MRKPLLFLLGWFLFPLLLFGASSSRLLTYVLPGAPALALLAGHGIARAVEAGEAPRAYRILGLGARASGLAVAVLSLGALLLYESIIARLPASAREAVDLVGKAPFLATAAVGLALAAGGWFLPRVPSRGVVLLATALALAAASGRLVLDAAGTLVSAREIAAVLARDGGSTPVVNAGRLHPSLEFYRGRPNLQHGPPGELSFGRAFDDTPWILPRPDGLRRLLEKHGAVYIIAATSWKTNVEFTLQAPLEYVAGGGENRLFIARKK